MKLYLVCFLLLVFSFNIQAKEINNWSFNTVPILAELAKKFTNIDLPAKKKLVMALIVGGNCHRNGILPTTNYIVFL